MIHECFSLDFNFFMSLYMLIDSSSGSEESESAENAESAEVDECQIIRQDSITFDQSLPVSHSVSLL